MICLKAETNGKTFRMSGKTKFLGKHLPSCQVIRARFIAHVQMFENMSKRLQLLEQLSRTKDEEMQQVFHSLALFNHALAQLREELRAVKREQHSELTAFQKQVSHLLSFAFSLPSTSALGLHSCRPRQPQLK